MQLLLLLLARDGAREFEEVHGHHGPGTALLQELLEALDAHASSVGRRNSGCASGPGGDPRAKLEAGACALRGGYGGGGGERVGDGRGEGTWAGRGGDHRLGAGEEQR